MISEIKTGYAAGVHGLLITRYTEDGNFHKVETKEYGEVIKDMKAGEYDGDLAVAMRIADLVMDASIRHYFEPEAEDKAFIARFVFCITFVRRMDRDFGRVEVPEDIDPSAHGSAVIIPMGNGVATAASMKSIREMMERVFEVRLLDAMEEKGHPREAIHHLMPIFYGEFIDDDLIANDMGVDAVRAVIKDIMQQGKVKEGGAVDGSFIPPNRTLH
ncbi:hypothetical protein ACENW9_000854 [Escherichia coli]